MISRIPPLAIAAYTVCSAAGHGRAALLHALRTRATGLRRNDFGATPLDCWIGRVDGVEAAEFPREFARWDCRNNRLAWLGLNADGFLDAARAALAHHGATRVALVLGTSTASIGATEEAYRHLDAQGRFPAGLGDGVLHSPHSLAAFVQAVLGIEGPVFTVATACSSSAKVFAQAQRLIAQGVAEAAVVGGVDSLCDSVLYGFNSLELVSPEPCRPFDAARRGLSIGEAAGFALLEKIGQAPHAPRLVGWGESSDAHHMSSPHPEGLGARLAMRDALARAGLREGDVDYINLHGTATPKNDEVEAQAIAAMFPATTRASSTKGWTGHTLGAAGIVEAAIALTALEHGFVPGTLHCDLPDAACGPQLAQRNEERALRIALSNSFGFGGNNCCLAFASAADVAESKRPADFQGATDLVLSVQGIGAWMPGIVDWPALRAIVRGEGVVAEAAGARPAPTLLPPAERRRAPDTVLLAVQAAAEACAMAQADAATLPCVFASSQGDIAITDAMCATLASAPQELSPTKFHNSVHNAPAGYWTIATQCRRASTALSAREHSVGAGLLEAAVQALHGAEPVLLACYDCAAGATPLVQVAPHATGFAAAFVLAPAGAGGRTLRLRRVPADTPATPWPATNLPTALAGNPSAAALALLAALAQPAAARVQLHAAPGMMLSIELDADTA